MCGFYFNITNTSYKFDMILDRTWNKKEQKLVISYIDKEGNRQFYQKYFHHFKTYEYDENGDVETWNNRKARKVFKDTTNYTPNEFDILEFMYELPEDLNKAMHAQYFPKLYFFDIETKYDPTTFPDPETALHQVTSISLVGPDMSCIVYGLRNLSEDQINLLRSRYLEWIDNNEFAKNMKKKLGKEPKVLYQYFADEKEMLKHFFIHICPKIACLAGWNSYGFDFYYLTTRLKVLFGEAAAYSIIKKASPTGEVTNIKITDQVGQMIGKIPAPSHSIWLDYMEIVKKYDYVLRPYESYSLDWVGEHAVKANKIKYEGTLNDLYEKDIEWYYFYNAIDSLIGLLIHYRLKSLESPCSVSSVTLVPLLKAFGQVALTTANVFYEFYQDNKRVVYDYDSVERYKVNYEGAFCGCVAGRYSWNVCDDFKSLYPSQVQTCNLSFENFLTPPALGPDSLGRYVPRNWTQEELEAYRKDPNYFVSIMGNVYKNDKDYAFKRMQRRVLKSRDVYKYTGQKIDSELLTEIDRLIKEKESVE